MAIIICFLSPRLKAPLILEPPNQAINGAKIPEKPTEIEIFSELKQYPISENKTNII